MDPVAGIGDVLDVGIGEQPLDFWVIVRAETGAQIQTRRDVRIKTGRGKTKSPKSEM